jgi:hypothetical protein
MLGPKSRGYWTDSIAPAAFMHLVVGTRYEVVRKFKDYDGGVHRPGETWWFLGHRHAPHDNERSLFVSPEKKTEWCIRLKEVKERQGRVIDDLKNYIHPAGPNATPLFVLRLRRLAAYMPIAAAFSEIPWLIFLFMCLLFVVGDAPYMNTPAMDHILNILSVLPSIAGLILAILCIMFGWARTVMQSVVLAIGVLACTAWLAGFASEIIH